MAETTTQERTNGAATPAPVPAVQTSSAAMQRGNFFADGAGFDLIQRMAKAFASSTLVPEQYRGNVPNCMIALDMAQRLGASVLMVAQNLYVVHGRPGWSSKFLIASFNQCGRFSAVRYEWTGTEGKDDWGCRAWAVELKTGEKIVGPLITIALAKKEKWYEKNGSKWQTIPELMLMYRSAGWLVNTHAPEISMGLNTTEELDDIDMMPAPDGAFEMERTSTEVAGKTADKTLELKDKYGPKKSNGAAPAAETTAASETKAPESEKAPAGDDTDGY